MTRTIYRVLATLSAISSGIGGLIAMPGFEPLGIPAEAGAICALTSGIVGIVSLAIRANFPSSDGA